MWMTILLLYVAFIVVIYLHELGHFPQYIKFKFGIIPRAAAMNAKYRIGGLIVNIVLFVAVATYEPEWTILQYIGLIAWGHYILYAILGSIIPEPKKTRKGRYYFDLNHNGKKGKREKFVNLRTFVFDDVDNKYAIFFIGSAIVAYLMFQDYYQAIFMGIIS